MQVTSQCRVDAPVEWVRSFLLAGTTDDDVTVDGDVVEVRQRDRLIHLVVRNTLRADADGGTQLDVDAQLHLRGMARIVGGVVFRGRVRRTLERSLDRLPTAIEQALATQEAEDDAGEYEAREDESAALRAERDAGKRRPS
jgi:carbon monoxide dehydrogenase subunit G